MNKTRINTIPTTSWNGKNWCR